MDLLKCLTVSNGRLHYTDCIGTSNTKIGHRLGHGSQALWYIDLARHSAGVRPSNQRFALGFRASEQRTSLFVEYFGTQHHAQFLDMYSWHRNRTVWIKITLSRIGNSLGSYMAGLVLERIYSAILLIQYGYHAVRSGISTHHLI